MACYVGRRAFRGPLAAWRGARNKPADLSAAVGAVAGRWLRLGAYGDTGALPRPVVEALVQSASRHTNYTHAPQWRALADVAMVSAQTLGGAVAAWRAGMRTFRVLGPEDRTSPNEVLCPNYTHGTRCIDCGLCDGTRPGDTRKSIAIPAH